MKIYDYCSNGGKNLIIDYIENLDSNTKEMIYYARELINQFGFKALNSLNCKKLYKKVYEIKIKNQRLAYFIDGDCIFFIHIFKKQKNKTENNDLKIIKQRLNRIVKGD